MGPCLRIAFAGATLSMRCVPANLTSSRLGAGQNRIGADWHMCLDDRSSASDIGGAAMYGPLVWCDGCQQVRPVVAIAVIVDRFRDDAALDLRCGAYLISYRDPQLTIPTAVWERAVARPCATNKQAVLR